MDGIEHPTNGVTVLPAIGSGRGEGSVNLLAGSSLYQEFLAKREEILKRKWIESEKAGHDIGLDRALVDWMLKHHTNWRRARLAAAGATPARQLGTLTQAA
jgi:hypothetical protein